MIQEYEPVAAVPDMQDSPVTPITQELIAEVRGWLEQEDVDTLHAFLDELHAADKAELLNRLDEEERTQLTGMMAEAFDHTILPELHADAMADVMEALGVDKYAEAVSQLETDDAMFLIEEMEEEDQQDLLQAVPESLRHEIEERLAYPEDSAGRMMTKKLVCVPEFWTVGDTIDYLRAHQDLPENFYVVYVVDPRYHPVGRILLGKVMQNPRDTKIGDIMSEDSHHVYTDTDQEQVAHLFTKYALVEAAVINRDGRLVGTITVDDVVHVIHEEEGEDYLLAGGVKSQDLHESVLDTVRQRVPWLAINLLTAVASAFVISQFAQTIEELVALAVLMPIVSAIGGNAGIQSVTVAVRALAMRQLVAGREWRVIGKELMVGGLNGLCLSVMAAGGAYLWSGDIKLAGVFGAAIIINLLVAGLFGAAIPLLLTRLKVDPAVSSGIFLTMMTDVIGFLGFLGLATIILIA